MIIIECIKYLLIFLLIDILVGAFCVDMLDKKTRCEDYKSIGIDSEYILLFIFCNLFCLLFINKIKEKRKVEYYKSLLRYYEPFNVYLENDTELTSKILKIKRYLKLKKI